MNKTVDERVTRRRVADQLGGDEIDLRGDAASTVRVRVGPDVERLVEAAWVVLDRSGWEGLKVDLVVNESGLSTRSFYRHFRSKNELLMVLMEDEITRSAAIMVSLVESLDDPIEQVIACIEGIVGLACHPATEGRTKLFLSLWWALAREFPVDVEHCQRALLAPLAAILERGRELGLFPLADPWPDAVSILYLAIGHMGEYMNAADRTPEEASVFTQRFVLRALTGDPSFGVGPLPRPWAISAGATQ